MNNSDNSNLNISDQITYSIYDEIKRLQTIEKLDLQDKIEYERLKAKLDKRSIFRRVLAWIGRLKKRPPVIIR